jgi:hypothetical protein
MNSKLKPKGERLTFYRWYNSKGFGNPKFDANASKLVFGFKIKTYE